MTCKVCGRRATWQLKTDTTLQLCNKETRCSSILELMIAQYDRTSNNENNGDEDDDIDLTQTDDEDDEDDMLVESDSSDDDDDDASPPEYVQDRIRLHHRASETPPSFLEIKQSFIDSSGVGVFTTISIAERETLGTYGGTVFFTKKAVRVRDPNDTAERIFSFKMWNQTFWVDGDVKEDDPGATGKLTSWTSRINHQWEWPSPSKRPPRQEWRPVFANCEFVPSGNDVGTLLALRHIENGEELSIDYGRDYWDSHSRTVQWNWWFLQKRDQISLYNFGVEAKDDLAKLRLYRLISNVITENPSFENRIFLFR